MILPKKETLELFSRVRNCPDAALLTLMVTVVYGACAVVPYVMSDDYGQMLYIAHGWTDWLTNGLSVDGRPLASLLIYYGFALAGGLTHLFVLRLAAFAGALWYAHYLRSSLQRMGFNRSDSFMFAALSVLSPGMGELIGWTVSWPYPFVLLFVTWLSVRISEQEENTTPAKLAVSFIACVLAMQVVLLTYQPVAGFLVVVPFLLLSRNRFRPLAFSAAALTLSFAIYRLAIFPSLHFLSPAMGTGSRAQTTANLTEHILYMAVRFFSFCGSSWSALVLPRDMAKVFGWSIVVLATVGLIVLCRRWQGYKAVGVLLLALFAIAISAPHVFVLDDVWAFRTHYPMTVLFALAAWIGFSVVIKPSWHKRAFRIALLLLFLAAAWSVNVGMVYTASREYQLVREALQEIRTEGVQSACVLLAPDDCYAQSHILIHPHSCYGYISLILMSSYEVSAVAPLIWPDERDRPQLLFVSNDHLQEIPSGMKVVDLWGRITGSPSVAAVH